MRKMLEINSDIPLGVKDRSQFLKLDGKAIWLTPEEYTDIDTKIALKLTQGFAFFGGTVEKPVANYRSESEAREAYGAAVKSKKQKKETDEKLK